jgi:hypothetical protein
MPLYYLFTGGFFFLKDRVTYQINFFYFTQKFRE